jgi:archaellum component FlaF (FlaF/FlaG flagellin family)
MKNFKHIFTLSLVALVGLSLTGCSSDNLDTNPYNKSGVNLVAFGPSPILRTQEIRITGTNLTQVTAVAFPGGASVEKGSFNKVDDRDIYVNVPDESVPGQIKLMVGSEAVSSSVSPITFVEPIEVSSVTPVTGLNAGDEITVKGEYVYNIYEAIFTSGVTGAAVRAEDFTYVSRHEIRFLVPLGAESGEIVFTDGADWEYEYETPLEVLPATYTGISTTTTDFGQQIQISGTNLHTVETVMFPGGVAAEFTVSDDHKTLSTTVPAETKSGAITLVLYSGASLTTAEVSVPTLTVSKVSKDKDLRVGDVITITGENFDRIATISLPGYGMLAENEYKLSGNTLTITIPDGTTDGNLEIVQNSFISVSHKLMMFSEAPETAIWTGSFTIAGWDVGMQDLAWGGYDWSTAVAGQTLTVYLTPDMSEGWSQIRVGNGSWAALPGTADVNELTAEDTKFTVTLTQEMIDEMVNNGGLVICGAYFTVTKITLSVLEETIWSGSFSLGAWENGLQDLAWGGYDWSQVSAGTTLKLYYEVDPSVGYINIRFGNGSWAALPSTVDWGNDGNASPDPSETTIETRLTADDMDQLLNAGGLVICGAGIVCKKIVLQ